VSVNALKKEEMVVGGSMVMMVVDDDDGVGKTETRLGDRRQDTCWVDAVDDSQCTDYGFVEFSKQQT